LLEETADIVLTFFVRRPLLTVETEANGDLCSTNETGPLLAASWFVWQVQEIFYPALATPVSPVKLKNIFFSLPYNILLCRHRSATWALWAGTARQSCRVACLIMCASG
jgi:hypothetical protein